MLEFHVTALANTLGGTISGSSDERAGRPITRNAALSPRIAYIHGTEPGRYESSASPSEHTAAPAELFAMIRRRSNTSAQCPAGSASANSGITWIPATHPSASFEPVRSYTSHPSAVDTMGCPSTEITQPTE